MPNTTKNGAMYRYGETFRSSRCQRDTRSRPGRARRRGGAGRVSVNIVMASSAGDVLDIGECLLPGSIRSRLSLLDGDQRVADGVAELAGVRPERLVLDVLRGVGEDL